jgi:uncharacterized protein
MIHPHTAVRFINEHKGNGLVATRFIPKGTITWVLDKLDREIPPAEMEGYEEKYQDILMTYSFRNSCGNYIFCWDNGRYINHSFNPNCCLTAYRLEIAIRDIQSGEELTDDYGYLNIIAPFEVAQEEGERTVVYPDDLLRYSAIWDQQLVAAFPYLTSVAQPLQTFVDPQTWQTLLLIQQGKKQMVSIQTCYYPGS